MINLLKPRIFALLASTIVLSGCQNPATDILDILAPVGAPSLALYSYATDSHFVTNASVPVIKAAFFDETTDIIIVDHQQGLKQITEQNADFSLARIITKGNLHLVGLNKAADAIPTSADHIISFGAASAVVNEVLFHLYPDIAPIVTFVASLSDIAPIMTLGQYNQTAVDFVLVAEPLLSKVVSNSNGDIIYQPQINLQTAWHDATALDGYPQAGLFVRNATYEAKPELIEEFLLGIDQNITNLISNPAEVKIDIDENGDTTWQTNKFGIETTTMVTLQEVENRLGMTVGGIDVNEFNALIDIPLIPDAVFSPLYK